MRGEVPPLPPARFSAPLNELVGALLQRDPAARPSLQQVGGGSSLVVAGAYCFPQWHCRQSQR